MFGVVKKLTLVLLIFSCLFFQAALADYPNCTNSTTTGIWNVTASKTIATSQHCSAIYVSNNAVLTVDSLAAGNASLEIRAANITVDAGSKIISDAKGYAAIQGPGAGATGTCGSAGSGAAHAGYGGNGYGNAVITSTYGSVTWPVTMGSGGGNMYGAGGAGGGAFFINASNALVVNGIISSNGGAGCVSGSCSCGGGAGGSVIISAAAFSGNGNITAIGGSGGGGSYPGGGGSAGRIAVYSDNYIFSGRILAIGGLYSTISPSGGTGTVYIKANSSAYGNLIIDNGYQNTVTRLMQNESFQSILVRNSTIIVGNNSSLFINGSMTIGPNATVDFGASSSSSITGSSTALVKNTGAIILNGSASFSNLNVETGGSFTCARSSVSNSASLNGTISLRYPGVLASSALFIGGSINTSYNYIINISASSMTLASSGKISADGSGFGANSGLGNGTPNGCTTSGGSGAGYGGTGGATGVAGGVAYGSMLLPLLNGSGGGTDYTAGSSGGGILVINATNFSIDGVISSRGTNQSASLCSGGAGSGGSILVWTGALTGNGSLDASGGSVPTASYPGGGGAGGRIAVYSSSDSMTVSRITNGGLRSGAASGSAGTAFSSASVAGSSTLSPSYNRTASLNASQTISSLSNLGVEWTHSSSQSVRANFSFAGLSISKAYYLSVNGSSANYTSDASGNLLVQNVSVGTSSNLSLQPMPIQSKVNHTYSLANRSGGGTALNVTAYYFNIDAGTPFAGLFYVNVSNSTKTVFSTCSGSTSCPASFLFGPGEEFFGNQNYSVVITASNASESMPEARTNFTVYADGVPVHAVVGNVAGLNISVGGSQNDSYYASLPVEIKVGSDVVVSFTFNFSSSDLNISKFSVFTGSDYVGVNSTYNLSMTLNVPVNGAQCNIRVCHGAANISDCSVWESATSVKSGGFCLVGVNGTVAQDQPDLSAPPEGGQGSVIVVADEVSPLALFAIALLAFAFFEARVQKKE